ncbi:MAG: hypothetical protein AAGC55_20830, partial [Myxococcota bacterium]
MLRIALSILLIAGLSATGLGLTGCGDDDGTDTESDAGGTADDAGGADAGSTDGAAGDATGSLDCDYQTVAGIAVIEAEALPITEEWSTGKDADASGGQYIQWTGQSRNNNTEFGRFEITVAVAAPGLYKLQWYNRIGMGDNATEHNDTWVQFPDVAEFYAIQGPADAEDRVYPRPRCEDAEFLATVEVGFDGLVHGDNPSVGFEAGPRPFMFGCHFVTQPNVGERRADNDFRRPAPRSERIEIARRDAAFDQKLSGIAVLRD